MITSLRYAPISTFVKISSTRASVESGEIRHLIFLYTYFSQNRLQVEPIDRCSSAVAQKTWNHSRMCLLGVRTLNL